MIQSVDLPPSAPPVHIHCSSHYIFSAHCSKSSVHLQCTYTAAVITFSVHTAANLQCTSSAHTLQQSLHLQCTLQQIFSAPPVHIHCSSHYIFSAHCSYTIWFQYSPFSAPLNHHRVHLYHYWSNSRTVSRH